jgi:hypothetical protein
MTAEYSFFRAEGLSLSAVETAEDARLEFTKTVETLKTRYGACALFLSNDKDTGRLRFDCFAYRRGDKTPDGWVIETAEDQPGSLASGMPKPGSPDDFYLAGMAGLLDRAAKNQRIEYVLGVDDMPRKEIPAGEYHGSFVRNNSLKTAGEKAVGQLRDRTTGCFGSNGRISMGDPVDYMKLEGNWYLRVPNKPGTEEPQFAPADALPMDYARMLELDKAEYALRYARPAQPFSPGSGRYC